MTSIACDLESDVVVLPPPGLRSGVTLERALRRRLSTRTFLPDALPLDTLSVLLWAGFGVNRPRANGRTAPSAHNWQEVDIYAALAEGVYRYDSRGHRLLRVSSEDERRRTGTQDFVASAPLDLVYVADFARMTDVREEDREFLAGADAGCIAQNVYLCCAGMGLATVVRGMIDRAGLAPALKLTTAQRIVLAQTVGYPGREV